MAKISSKDITIEVDDQVGGTLTDISAFVRTINGIEVEALLEESHGFGVAWFEHAFTGMNRMNPIELGGIYDTVAGGPKALFLGKQGEQRSFRISLDTDTTSVETLIGKFTRSPELNGLTKWNVMLQPTGTVVEA